MTFLVVVAGLLGLVLGRNAPAIAGLRREADAAEARILTALLVAVALVVAGSVAMLVGLLLAPVLVLVGGLTAAGGFVGFGLLQRSVRARRPQYDTDEVEGGRYDVWMAVVLASLTLVASLGWFNTH